MKKETKATTILKKALILIAAALLSLFCVSCSEAKDTESRIDISEMVHRDEYDAMVRGYESCISELESRIIVLGEELYRVKTDVATLPIYANNENSDEGGEQNIGAGNNDGGRVIPMSNNTQTAAYTYKTVDGEAVITSYSGNGGIINIPAYLDGYRVVGIGERVFAEHTDIKCVIIPEGVENIDWFAFYGCSSLASVTIPQSVRLIGYSAFDGCAKGFTINCVKGSYAEKYASSFGFAYISE